MTHSLKNGKLLSTENQLIFSSSVSIQMIDTDSVPSVPVVTGWFQRRLHDGMSEPRVLVNRIKNGNRTFLMKVLTDPNLLFNIPRIPMQSFIRSFVQQG